LTNKTKGWSDERRAKQAENIRKTQPWKTTTGPKTTEGKAAVAQNALRSGFHTADMQALKKAVSRHAKMLRETKKVRV